MGFDDAVGPVVTFALNELRNFVAHEVSLFQGVDAKRESLRNALAVIQGFLLDAEDRQSELEGNETRTRLKQIRNVAYRIEDELDDYELRGRNAWKRQGCFAWFPTIWMRRNFGVAFEYLKNQIPDSSTMRQLLERRGNEDDAGDGSSGRERESFTKREERLIGMKAFTGELLGKLLDGNRNHFIIAIHGMGGLGKTAVARELYHHFDSDQSNFKYRAWVTVSQFYRTTDHLREIINSFLENMSRPREEIEKIKEMEKIRDLGRYLYNLLSQKIYLIVLDDMWQVEDLGLLLRAFPKENGSRVIITTRNKEVAEPADWRTYAREVPPLDFEKSWDLFCEEAFESPSMIDEQAESVGGDLVQKCNGLPLAIIILGGYLRRKSLTAWRRVQERMWRELVGKSERLNEVFTLSFGDLHYHLKLCFLYLSVFPEGYAIQTPKLILLLVAEGLILPSDHELMEEVAERYLLELMDRNLIEAKRTRRGNLSPTFRVHGLLLEQAVDKAKELEFIQVYKESSEFSSSSCRRQAVHAPIDRYLSIQGHSPGTRSLIFFDDCRKGVNRTKVRYNIIYETFKFLRVLDLEFVMFPGTKKGAMSALPDGLGDLIFLRFLVILNTLINHFSASIAHLSSLQTLIVIGEPVFLEKSVDIRNLTLLRHLAWKFSGLILVDNPIHLQTLKYISFGAWRNMDPTKLHNLRELRVTSDYSAYPEENVSFNLFARLRNLRVLELKAGSFSESSLEELSECSNLIDMSLSGVLKNFPVDAHTFFPKLECLKLSQSKLEMDPLPVLEKFTALTYLVFGPESYFGEKMTSNSNGFQNLEILDLRDCKDMKELSVENSAMRKLRILAARDKLNIPQRLLSTLKQDSDKIYSEEYERGPEHLPWMY